MHAVHIRCEIPKNQAPKKKKDEILYNLFRLRGKSCCFQILIIRSQQSKNNNNEYICGEKWSSKTIDSMLNRIFGVKGLRQFFRMPHQKWLFMFRQPHEITESQILNQASTIRCFSQYVINYLILATLSASHRNFVDGTEAIQWNMVNLAIISGKYHFGYSKLVDIHSICNSYFVKFIIRDERINLNFLSVNL